MLYSRLPAQLVSLSGVAQARRWETVGIAMVAEESFRKVRLFMAKQESLIEYRERGHSTPTVLTSETARMF